MPGDWYLFALIRLDRIRAIKDLTVYGKGGKIRYIPAHPRAVRLVENYLDSAGHWGEPITFLFRSVAANVDDARRRLNPGSAYRNVVMYYCKRLGIVAEGMGPHALRATSATNAHSKGSDIAELQEWLGHSGISTTRVYDKRRMWPEDSPRLKVKYKKKRVSWRLSRLTAAEQEGHGVQNNFLLCGGFGYEQIVRPEVFYHNFVRLRRCFGKRNSCGFDSPFVGQKSQSLKAKRIHLEVLGSQIINQP